MNTPQYNWSLEQCFSTMPNIISEMAWEKRINSPSMQRFVVAPEKKGKLPVFSYKHFKQVLQEEKIL